MRQTHLPLQHSQSFEHLRVLLDLLPEEQSECRGNRFALASSLGILRRVTNQHYAPGAILQIVFSFWSSKVLLTAVEFGDAFDYSVADLRKWCGEAGFKCFEVIHLAGPSSAAVACK